MFVFSDADLQICLLSISLTYIWLFPTFEVIQSLSYLKWDVCLSSAILAFKYFKHLSFVMSRSFEFLFLFISLRITYDLKKGISVKKKTFASVAKKTSLLTNNLKILISDEAYFWCIGRYRNAITSKKRAFWVGKIIVFCIAHLWLQQDGATSQWHSNF